MSEALLDGPEVAQCYNAIIGLGGWCGVSYNLRRYFRTARAYPMDWWVSGWASLCKLLDEDFAQLFAPGNLFVNTAEDLVQCRHYGLRHTHDFLRDANGLLVGDIAPQLPALRQKYASLVARMDADAALGHVLAVRSSMFDPGETPAAAQALQRALELQARLARRWPGARVALLVVEEQALACCPAGPHGPVTFEVLEDLGEPGQWHPLAWNRLFERQKLKLVPAGAC